MNKKIFNNSRVCPKGDIEANWNKAVGFIPLDKEIIIYKPDEAHPAARFKVGDGKTVIQDLPFSGTDIEAIEQLIDEKGELLIEYVDNAVAAINIPEQIQADWNQNDETAKDYIKNKPIIPVIPEGLATEEYVDEKVASIEIPEITVDQAYHSSSENAQSGKAVAEAIQYFKEDYVDPRTETAYNIETENFTIGNQTKAVSFELLGVITKIINAVSTVFTFEINNGENVSERVVKGDTVYIGENYVPLSIFNISTSITIFTDGSQFSVGDKVYLKSGTYENAYISKLNNFIIKDINAQKEIESLQEQVNTIEVTQSDWSQIDENAKDYIKNKPIIPIIDQVYSKESFNAQSGVAVTEALNIFKENYINPLELSTKKATTDNILSIFEEV